MPAVSFPHTFHDNVGEPASGVQVDDNLNALKTAVEACLGLLTPANVRVAFGKFTAPGGFDSAAGRSRRVDAIPHGLGATPSVALVSSTPIAITENGGATPEAVACSVASVDATNINVVSTAPGTTNNGANVYWLAIG